MNQKPKSCLARIWIACFSLLGICVLLAAAAALSNRNLPTEPSSATLSAVDKARLLEALHLKTELGDQAWPGWGTVDIPVILWNRSYEFLADYGDKPPECWSRVEGGLNGQTLYRRAADNPQNFAVRVGDAWVASMATKQTTDRFLIDTFRDNFPFPIKQIFPYRLLIQPSETQMGGVLHEGFHVYQSGNAPERMAEAESIHKLGEQYQTQAKSFQQDWKKESKLLADALEAKTKAEKLEFVRQFLETREARRRNSQLEEPYVNYERWLEWEEGTAKYIEVASLRKAGETAGYQSLPEMKNDPDFKQYKRTSQRWSQELIQLRYQSTSGESQLYMTGMAQAFLLDDLAPGWKDQYWNDGVFLEDLLRQAVEGD
jgi:hypothetical protein